MLEDRLVRKYARKGILVDSSLLVVYVIGNLSVGHLAKCRATKNFTGDDFGLLADILAAFGKVVTTAHILTEVSNLAGQLPESLREEFRAVFRAAINNLREDRLAATTIANSDDFIRFGVTDTAIRLLSPGSYLVLTTDLPLYGLLAKRGVDVVNFNQL